MKIDLNHLTPEPEKNFWASSKSKLQFRKTTRNIESATVTLDLSRPYDYLLYKMALVNPRVANTWADRYDKGKGGK